MEDHDEIDAYFESAMPGNATQPLFEAAARLGVGFYLGYAELAEEAGRDPSTIDILAFGHAGHFKSREHVQELQEAGATHVTLWLEQTTGDGALTEMEAMARQVF